MLKIVATTALALILADFALAETNEREAGAEVTDAGENDASERARAVLAERLKIPVDDISVKRVEPATWSDSSMGCGKPGTMALTVITEGHAVTLSAQGRDHRVHVSKSSAVICDRPALLRRDGRTATNAHGLDLMLTQAREDLARKLGVQVSAIKVSGMQPRQFADSALACPSGGEALKSGPVAGYELSLRHGRRFFTYYTDLKTVRACPPIETK